MQKIKLLQNQPDSNRKHSRKSHIIKAVKIGTKKASTKSSKN